MLKLSRLFVGGLSCPDGVIGHNSEKGPPKDHSDQTLVVNRFVRSFRVKKIFKTFFP